MCSIMFYFRPDLTKELFQKGFSETVSRGPDQSRIIDLGDGIMGFHRLAIMGLTEEGMQPFSLGAKNLVCNGEIYGFEKFREELIADGYTFASDSDCEILLPLYEKYGVEMFSKLDAEFALIIYDTDTKSVIAARDPIGIRPLYYGYDKDGYLVLASEAKNLVPYCEKILPFPPGHYYKDGKFTCYCDITKVDQVITDDIETICKNIHDKLVEGIRKRLVSDSKVGFLLSGGLDSSLVCAVAQSMEDHPIKTFAIGMSEDAIDLKYAKQVADYIHSEHTEVIITKEDVISSLPEVIKILGTYDITTIRASMGMYLLCKKIHEISDVRVLLTGEISDELFGYKYTDFAPTPEAFQEESKKRIKELYMYDVLRADRCISANALEGRVPFADLRFVDYAMSINPDKKMNHYNKGKYLLRHAFEGLDYLPDDILFREKAAFSDAVGHSMVDYLKEYAEEKYTEEDVLKAKEKYTYGTPFTKESLLYRNIFEEFYPDSSKWIKDFWMPNKTWEHCDVNDPSARFLDNYGDSGK